MSHPHSTAVSSANFQLIFNNALKDYQKRTKGDLLTHPLAAELQTCDSPGAILVVLQQQVLGPGQSRSSGERLTKWLDPTVNVLYAFSATLGEGVGLVFSPAKVIFAGLGVLLLAARDVSGSQDTLVNMLERIESFFQRLEIYTEVAMTLEMTDIVVKIMVEVLSILAIATTEMKQGRTKKYLKRLAGKTDIEDALKRLDQLTHEEARLATAQVLKVTRNVDERLKGVCDNVATVMEDGREAKTFIQKTVNDVDWVKGNQLRQDLRRWLSPSDPSTNHNIACRAHHKGTATWFFQGSIFGEWKSTGSLLWIHGKPGSGKSVLCSTIIQDVDTMCKAGQAFIGYFYFDFRDANKQHWRDLVLSLLVQLSARSDTRCDILSRLYMAHDSGAQQPNDDVLLQSLKEMITFPDQRPIYLIMDAVDECPNTSGIPSPREQVVKLIKELVDLSLPNLHILVTSRPELDIRDILESLTSLRVSLHDQSGQRKDIVDYVRSVVYSDSEPIMRRWKTEDKDLVVETLSDRADGMFRWVFCQLETLRHCLPPSIRRTLEELPESLDETYKRILKEIKKPNSDHAYHLLQCLVVAFRPLRVEELAEIFAIDFDAEGSPKLNPSWRWEDQEQAILSACSSLIAVVDAGDSRVVQFSHFSVKEFLTSPRLATSSRDISRYHIALEPAHTILAQACMGILLKLDDRVEMTGVENNSPLAAYSAQHWVRHAQFQSVSSHLHKEMQYLFDPEKPYFAAWLDLHDIDTKPRYCSTFYEFTHVLKSNAAPLYYAALCGFRDLVEHLIAKYPQQVNASGGYYLTPIIAALAGRHFRTAELLHRHGSSADPRGYARRSPLYSAALYGDLEMVRVLLEYGADIHARSVNGRTPLHVASKDEHINDPEVVRVLLERGADVNARDNRGNTPLHLASRGGRIDAVRVLLEHDADVEAEDGMGRTPFQVASEVPEDKIAKLLKEHGDK